MSNSPISQALQVKLVRTGRWMVACLGMSMLAVSMGHAQLTTPVSTILMAVESGLHWVEKDALATVTTSSARAATAFASVRMEFRDPAGGLVAGITAPVGPGTPAYLRLQNNAGLRQLSLYVRVTGFADAGNAPVTVWENISPTGSITVGGSCGPAGHGGGGQYMCEGFRDLTIPQPTPQ